MIMDSQALFELAQLHASTYGTVMFTKWVKEAKDIPITEASIKLDEDHEKLIKKMIRMAVEAQKAEANETID